jgi:branched-chain amino acid transport system substrate-binding protein
VKNWSKKGLIALTLGLLVSAMFVISCAPSKPAVEAEKVVIGYTGPLTGGAALFGINCRDGLMMAADKLNKAGGIKVGGTSYNFEIVALDNRYIPAEGVAAYKRLVSEHNIHVFFTPQAFVTIPVMSFNVEDNVLIFTYSGLPTLMEPGNPLFIRIAGDSRAYIGVFCETARGFGYKKLSLLRGSDSFGDFEFLLINAIWPYLGGEILEDAKADFYTVTDFYPYLTPVLAKNPDVIFITGPSEPGGLLIKQARELGYKGGFICGQQIKMNEIVSFAGGIGKCDGCIGNPAFWEVVNAPQTSKERKAGLEAFAQQYKERFGPDKDISWDVGLNYEAFFIMAHAMEEAGTVTDAKAIREAIAKVLPVKEQVAGFYGVSDAGALQYDISCIAIKGGKYTDLKETSLEKWERFK